MARLGPLPSANRSSRRPFSSNDSSPPLQGHNLANERFPDAFAAAGQEPGSDSADKIEPHGPGGFRVPPPSHPSRRSPRAWMAARSRPLLFLALATAAFYSGLLTPFLPRTPWDAVESVDCGKASDASPLPALDVFQVQEPVLLGPSVPVGPAAAAGLPFKDGESTGGRGSGRVCQEVLMHHSFAFSYGRPFVGPYNPPASCEFNRVTFNLTVVSAGRQFDRLGILYFGDTEIFRTSTAEPTASGIRWTYLKDMSSYLALFKLPQKIIFDLGNLIDDTYTAPFNATLTASFFSAAGQPTWADAILPISAQRSSSGRPSAFSIPQQKAASKITLPQNIRRAAVTISACGQADEEFWFGNVLTSDRSVFPLAGEPLLGYSPFREVQLLIDGELAGVAWPFPIIFTGGVVPGLWRPVVGIDTFDLREREIDITPWLPILCDGASSGHTFEIRVVGIDDDGSGNGSLSKVVGNSWIVTGKIFLWLGEAGSITTGTRPIVSVPEEPMISIVSSVLQNSTGDNETLSYNVTVHRQLSISSLLDTSAGHRVASWTQTLAYENNGHLTKQGNLQAIDQLTTGSDMSASGYASTYSFPVSLTTEFAIDRTSGVFTIDAEISRGLVLDTFGTLALTTGLTSIEGFQDTQAGLPRLSGTSLRTIQNGSGHYMSTSSNGISSSSGATEQRFLFGALGTASSDEVSEALANYEIYRRHVLAVNGSVRRDEESFHGEADSCHPSTAVDLELPSEPFAASDLRALIGRGPGMQKPDLVSAGDRG